MKVFWYHKNLKCQGFMIGNFYFDISFPPMEGWGFSWKRLIRIFWHTDEHRHYFYLPSCSHVVTP